MKLDISQDWKEFIWYEFEKEYFKEIVSVIDNEIKIWNTVFPSNSDIFNAFNYCPLENVKVVILGQDPYHGEKQAHGLSFSMESEDAKFPPSLRNIHIEMNDDLWINNTWKRNLSSWAKSWVLLLNSTLTVRKWEPNSHEKIGWQIFTDKVINKLSEKSEKVVFVLWWNFAIKKRCLIDESKHLVITSPHPSPFSARKWFFGSKPFSKINEYLEENWKSKINWKLD